MMKSTEKTKLVLLYMFVATLFVAATGCSTLTVNEALKSMNTDLDKAVLTRSDYYKKLADNYFEQNKYLEAIDHYRLSLLHNSKNNTSRFGLAQSYAAMDQNELALSEFNRCLAQNEEQLNGAAVLTDEQVKVLTYFFERSGSFERIYEINKSQFEKTGTNYSLWKMYELSLRLKKYDQAFEVLSLLAANKNSAEKAPVYLLYLSKAEIYGLQKNPERALKELELAEQEKPFDELLLKKKMQVLADLERWSDVILTGQKYIKYQKHTLPISDVITNAAIKIEDYQLAIDELKWQSNFFQDTNLYQLKIAHLNFLLRNYEVAENQYKELFGLPEYEDEIKYYLSLIYKQTNRSSLANSVLTEIHETSIYFADAQVKLSEIDYNDGDKASALTRLRRAYIVKKDSIALYKVYSEYLIENNNFAEAVALLEKGIENTAANEVLHMNLAFCYYKLRNYKMFKKEFDTVMSINPANAKTYEMLAELWYIDDKKNSEIEYFTNMAMKLDTQNESLMNILAWVYVDQNKLDKAVALFENLYDENPKDLFYSEMLSKIYFLKNIKSKAVEYATYAHNLRDEINIKEYLNELLKKRSTKYKNSIYEDQRIPASLE
jgi:tetratricopeptide (TPR) repeat protein